MKFNKTEDHFSFENNIEKILVVENHLFPTIKTKKRRYINHNEYLWLRKTGWPIESYKLISRISGINAFPDRRLKKWLEVFRNRGRGFKKRIGLFLRMPFLKDKILPIRADVYFDKGVFGILLFCKQNTSSAVKYNQIADNVFVEAIKKEAKILEFVGSFPHDVVKVPQFFGFNNVEGIAFYEQEMVYGKDLHMLSDKNREKVYNEVFDFLLQIQKDQSVELTELDDVCDVIKEEINNYFNDGDQIVDKYHNLFSLNKKMLSGFTHGDLSYNNVLYQPKSNQIFILDWGEGGRTYLAKDFKEHAGCAAVYFKKVIDYFQFDQEELYSFKEQLFIVSFNLIGSLIEDVIIDGKPDKYFHHKMNFHYKNMLNLNLF